MLCGPGWHDVTGLDQPIRVEMPLAKASYFRPPLASSPSTMSGAVLRASCVMRMPAHNPPSQISKMVLSTVYIGGLPHPPQYLLGQFLRVELVHALDDGLHELDGWGVVGVLAFCGKAGEFPDQNCRKGRWICWPRRSYCGTRCGRIADRSRLRPRTSGRRRSRSSLPSP